MRREREEARCERLVGAAQKVAERMAAEREEEEEEKDDDGKRKDVKRGQGEEREEEEKKPNPKKPASSAAAIGTRPLKSIPVVWRGLVRAREEAERERRMRHDLEQRGGLAARLPAYEDAEEDEDDGRALGRAGTATTTTTTTTTTTSYVVADDLDEEDAELDEFEALPAAERLRRVVLHLREEYRYCFWCKYRYPDEEMEGCPGLTEEDHD